LSPVYLFCCHSYKATSDASGCICTYLENANPSFSSTLIDAALPGETIANVLDERRLIQKPEDERGIIEGKVPQEQAIRFQNDHIRRFYFSSMSCAVPAEIPVPTFPSAKSFLCSVLATRMNSF